jgi:hypothetical protein
MKYIGLSRIHSLSAIGSAVRIRFKRATAHDDQAGGSESEHIRDS